MSPFRLLTSRQVWFSVTLSLIKGQVVETTAAHSPTIQTEIRPERVVEYQEDGRRHYFIDFGKTWFGRLRVTFRNTGSATQGVSFRSSEAVVGDDICEQDELCHGARQYRISLSAGPGISTDE